MTNSKKEKIKRKSKITLKKDWKQIVFYLLKGEVVFCENCNKRVVYDDCIIFYAGRYGEVKVALCENCDNLIKKQ